MRQIRIGIGRATETHCKNCPYDDEGYCVAFGRRMLFYDHDARSNERLEVCKDAEVTCSTQ